MTALLDAFRGVSKFFDQKGLDVETKFSFQTRWNIGSRNYILLQPGDRNLSFGETDREITVSNDYQGVARTWQLGSWWITAPNRIDGLEQQWLDTVQLRNQLLIALDEVVGLTWYKITDERYEVGGDGADGNATGRSAQVTIVMTTAICDYVTDTIGDGSSQAKVPGRITTDIAGSQEIEHVPST